MTPARILYLAAGRPDCGKATKPAPAGAVCRWCGLPAGELAVPAKKAEGGMFSDGFDSSAPQSEWWCRSCVFVKTGRPPKTYRMWSLVYREDRPAAPSHAKAHPSLLISERLHLAGRNDLSEAIDCLLSPPLGRWWVSCAESGQLHTLPRARVQTARDRWSVQLDRREVFGTPAELRRAIHSVASLYSAGSPKALVAALEPDAGALVRIAKTEGLDLPGAIRFWRQHEAILRGLSSDGLLSLALFLTGKETCHGLRARTADAGGCSQPGAAAYERGPTRDDQPEALVGSGDERTEPGGGEELLVEQPDQLGMPGAAGGDAAEEAGAGPLFAWGASRRG